MMKSLLVLLLSMASYVVYADKINVIVPEVITPGENAELIVELENSNEVAACQMYLYLPDNVTLARDKKNRFIFTLSDDRKDDHVLTITPAADGSFLFAIYSPTNAPLWENSGELFRVTLAVSEDFNASAQGSFKEIVVSTPDEVGTDLANVTFDLKTETLEVPITVTAKSYTIEYGDAMPTFEFTSEGGELQGTPAISCEATSTSPVGEYPIVISQGTVTNGSVTYVNGKLTIEDAVTNYGAAKITWNERGKTVEFNGSSEETINITSGIEVNGVIYNRTFTADRAATVMLPFSTSDGQTVSGGKFYQLVSVEYNETTNKWEATMKEPDQTRVSANTPYLFMPSSSTMTFDLNGGTVTLQTGASADVTPATDWKLIGTYAKKTWTEPSKDYGFAATSGTEAGGTATVSAGQFVRFTTNAFIKPMRCYLSFVGTSAPAPASGITHTTSAEELPQTITVRLVSRSGDTTAIGSLDTKTGELSFDGWYDMNGLKLNGKPTQKGMYIYNAKKVIIK